MIKRCLIAGIFFLFIGRIFAGDIASFVNLGFSDDSRYFMFAQYGVEEENSYPYVDTFIVDVWSNQFVSGGVLNRVYKVSVQPGYQGMGALFTTLRESYPLISRYGINHLKTGRMVYILLDGDEPKAVLNFRDFITGKNYTVTLVQSKFGSGTDVSAAFHIVLSVVDSMGNSLRTYNIGLPNYRRDGVKSYRIKKIIVSPDEKSMVFVVEKEMVDKKGINIRYMVETVKLKLSPL